MVKFETPPFTKRLGLALLLGSLVSVVSTGCPDPEEPPDDEDMALIEDMASRGDLSTPDSDQPDSNQPDLTEPDLSEPDLTEPDLRQPDLGEEDLSEEDMPEDMVDTCLLDGDSDGLSDCEEAMYGTDPTRPDSDFDGVRDGEEVEAGSDPLKVDTDDDGLTDFEEFQKGTDPTRADSDADGLNDKDELLFGFDPNNPSTLGGATLDGSLFIATACDNPESEEILYVSEPDGDWRLGLPTALDNYSRLVVPTAVAPVAAAVYDDSNNEVAGFILSTPLAGAAPVDQLVAYRATINGVAPITQDFTFGEFQTHDGFAAAPGEYYVSAGSRSARKLRDDLLFAMAPFGSAEVTSGRPPSAGTVHNQYIIEISVVERGDRMLTLVALAPKANADAIDAVARRLSDLTNTTGVARATSFEEELCHAFPITTEVPTADFYWVLDQSGSMNSYNSTLSDFAVQFVTKVANAGLDYRLAVTNMDPDHLGLPRPAAGWHTSPQVFATEVDQFVVNCPYNVCSGGDEYGLYVAELGIKHMTGAAATPAERIRPNAQLVTFFMSDEQENSIQSYFGGSISGRPDNLGGTDEATIMSNFIAFFKDRTTAYAIVTDGGACGSEDASAYSDVALATGGAVASLCATDLEQTIESIVEDTAGRASSFRLPDTPISASLRVYQATEDGLTARWVPRSRADGFDYFPQRNALAFFGSFRPKTPSKTMCSVDSDCSDVTTEQCRGGTCELRNPLQVAVHYQTFFPDDKNNEDDMAMTP